MPQALHLWSLFLELPVANIGPPVAYSCVNPSAEPVHNPGSTLPGVTCPLWPLEVSLPQN